ncbi:MucR family transcriptional regulator [Rhizobium sp. AC27/96]|uniref:MucR family transcriptional regulator n=1 Tax=Rhizobium sp. AC27/96 TaxID=1841653 RepID=UPI000827895C|nr:MucR family transcriptional regulator [Rhizobium sp. AC27/96]OCJ07359.1 MucR family transcriptional regulator [Rhizobium sp. AC27/96]
MEKEHTADNKIFVELTSMIVSAYIAHNVTAPEDLPRLILETHAALTGSFTPAMSESEKTLKPAVPIKKSITEEYLICLEDGGKFKSLKRHLNTKYGLSPDEYRKKWGLPADYPMVAASYAATRSTLAKKALLGHSKPAQSPDEAPARRRRKAG